MSVQSFVCRRVVSLAGLVAILSSVTVAQQSAIYSQPSLASQSLITQPVDEKKVTVLHGNTHPLALAQFDLGTAPATLPMQRMLLVLKRSTAQEFSLRKLLDNQQDKHSASYHKWLTPTQFGKSFGPSDSDMQVITAWLQSHGFEVGTSKGRTVLEFSGSASQVQEAFHTAIHRYIVNGEEHWANSGDPSIPSALTPAVAGVLTLHNFLKKPQLRMLPQPVPAKVRPGKTPSINFSDGTHGMAPADFATIYNFSSPNFIAGGGITIGVIGRSDLFNNGTDISDFGSEFGVVGGTFSTIVNGVDPGDLGGGEEAEATLDNTWAGAVAPQANIDFVVSSTTNTADGIDLSEVYIIENNLADIMTESFSSCEAGSTSAQAIGYSQLAEQAAAQGITYFVATGDSGAENCDDPDSETVAAGPVSVSVLAATPFNVAVGGTLFNDANAPAGKYWSTAGSSDESAISYIPENAWNDSCVAATCGTDNSPNIAAGGGGASMFFNKPSWQTGVAGIVSDNARDLPDVSLNADPHDGYVLCLDNSCVPDGEGEFSVYLVGGTSASTPSFAGIMADINGNLLATNPSGGTRQGLANYLLYKLASTETLSTCNGSNTTTLPGAACIFNDVTAGNNAVPGELNYGTTSAKYQATVGYDMATGLGSVNISNLISQWSTATFNASTTTLALAPNPTTIVHGQPVTVNIGVTATSGNGSSPVATGDVSLIALTPTSTNPNAQMALGEWTLGSGVIASTTYNLPGDPALAGGSYMVYAYYPGDSNYGGSSSPQVPVTVTAENSSTSVSAITVNPQGTAYIPFTGGPFGSFVYVRADVFGASGHGTPTGGVTFTDTFGAMPGGNVFALNSGDSFQSGSNAGNPNGVFNFDTGNHSVSASYTGDNSFDPSSSTAPLTFTITPGFFATTGNIPPTVSVAAGGKGITNVTVYSSTGFTGTISLACAGLPAGAACTFSPASIKGSGTSSSTASAITITTTAATSTAWQKPARTHFERWLAFSGFMLFSMVLAVAGRRRLPLCLLALLALILFSAACGGGGSSSTSPTPPAQTATPTPVGNYTIAVNASSGSVTYQSEFFLIVQ